MEYKTKRQQHWNGASNEISPPVDPCIYCSWTMHVAQGTWEAYGKKLRNQTKQVWKRKENMAEKI